MYLNHHADEVQVTVGLQDRSQGYVDGLGLKQHAHLADYKSASGFQQSPNERRRDAVTSSPNKSRGINGFQKQSLRRAAADM